MIYNIDSTDYATLTSILTDWTENVDSATPSVRRILRSVLPGLTAFRGAIVPLTDSDGSSPTPAMDVGGVSDDDVTTPPPRVSDVIGNEWSDWVPGGE
jgi:hypothetical protein